MTNLHRESRTIFYTIDDKKTTRKQSESFMRGRAWIELDMSALRHNVSVLQSLLFKGSELMPVVKADAYGHGAVQISKELNSLGIRAFCVASVQEGVELRKNGICGEILILGYTHTEDFSLLSRYHMIQTVIDYPYACHLNEYGRKHNRKIRVHIAIDTGMHRLGEPYENFKNLCAIFDMKNLEIEGIFTHLCTTDGAKENDRVFAMKQAQAFYHVISGLEAYGYPSPKIHMQSSYGILNYPEFSGDYARVGIALYGVLSTKKDTESCPLPLKPVLSLKARVATIKHLHTGESAGYGQQYVAPADRKIAVITIGYADGLPRGLSCGVGSVLIRGQRAPIIGRVCMDQTLVDVTDIPDLRSGDIAVLIGKSGNEQISAADLADECGTITNEILSRLGARVRW